ncbi:MAG TPA: hypothetical protein ENH55_13435 [Aurantimonas coralicida]|uniref:Uncharacterized protein n=1 Tax=Aurantimonas coralicida TaxID=182270 RepID=A0A9C9ND52_9HYPH|nr:hypothetical protein [Aurantimonas coralicida]HET99636.1 hypothetical protein [Aurantimonas coralicida]
MKKDITERELAFLQALAAGDTDPKVQTKRGLRSTAVGYRCRVKELAEFLWEFEDGEIGAARDAYHSYQEGHRPMRIIGQQLTDAGRHALLVARPY